MTNQELNDLGLALTKFALECKAPEVQKVITLVAEAINEEPKRKPLSVNKN